MKSLIIFDTGTGGHLFTERLRATFPKLKITNVTDTLHTPYGNKSPEEIIKYTEETLKPYLIDTNNLILLACNTATAYAIDSLRKKYPEIIFIGTEPMLKPAAALSKTKSVLVLATHATLHSPRYADLKSKFASDMTLLEPDCSSWAAIIDAGSFDDSLLKTTLAPCLPENPDIVVLGCTHYIKIKNLLANLFPNAIILDPADPIENRIRELLPPE